jgi:Molecular chaperone GrpE (heat shock protein)
MNFNDVSIFESKLDNLEKINKRCMMSLEFIKDSMDTNIKLQDSLKKELNEKEELNERIIKKMISIIDQVDNIYRYAFESENEQLLNNFNSTFKNITKDLREIGIEEIPTVGEIFDYELHQCIDTIEKNGAAQYEIVNTIKKGYKYNGKVLRPAYVIAAK